MIKHFLSLFVLVLLSVQAVSQNLDDEIEIIAQGEGERPIYPAHKMSAYPAYVEDTTQKQLEMDYVFYEYTAPSDFQLTPIKPAKIKVVDPIDKLRRGYLKAGVGTYLTPLVNFYYGSERSRNSNWGFNYNHFSSNQSMKNTGFSGLSNNNANFHYKHFLDEYYIKGTLLYDRDVNYFYGFLEEDTIIPKEEIKQRFQAIGGEVELGSYLQNIPEFNYHGKMSFRNYTDNYTAKENSFILSGGVQHIIDEELYGADLLLDVNSYKREGNTPLIPDSATNVLEKSTTSGIFALSPHIITNRNKLQAKVGLKIALNIRDKTNFHFYPQAEFKYAFHDVFIPYVGVDGGLTRNSFYSLSQENPFVLTDLSLQNTNTKYNIYGGIRGSFSKNISYNLYASQQKIQDLALFYTDTSFSIQNKFDVLYDTLDIFSATAQFTYKLDEKINVSLKGTYNHFSLLRQAYAWNKAPIEITLNGVYNLQDKLIARADIFFFSRRKALSLTAVDEAETVDNGYAIKLPAFFDFSLGLEYRYTQRVSVFLNFNNIIGKRYNLYHKYPVQSINILGGATVTF